MALEFNLLRTAKDHAEANVSELKTKLREEIAKSQQQSETKAAAPDVGRAKYTELVQAVLALQLVTDPLADMNLSLHQSFMDEAEQATTHLDEQARLVRTKLEGQEADMKALILKYEALVQERDAAVASAQKVSQSAQEAKLELDA